MLAYGLAVSAFQAAEDDGGEDGQDSEGDECFVDAVDHYGWAGVGDGGEEEGCG